MYSMKNIKKQHVPMVYIGFVCKCIENLLFDYNILKASPIWSEWNLLIIYCIKSSVASAQAHNIKMTSYQRRCDVITSHRRCYDVILTLCAHWNVSHSRELTSEKPCINKAIHVLLMHGYATFNIIVPGPQVCCRYEICAARP